MYTFISNPLFVNSPKQVGMDAAISSLKLDCHTKNILMYTINASTKAPKTLSSRASGRAGFSLVEVTMALGLMSFCLVAMLGMLPVGLKQERSATDQLGAVQVLAAVESDFRSSDSKFGINATPGSSDSFMVDSAGNLTSQVTDAAYRVWYQVSALGADQAARQMHLYVTRPQGTELAQNNVVAEGIVLN